MQRPWINVRSTLKKLRPIKNANFVLSINSISKTLNGWPTLSTNQKCIITLFSYLLKVSTEPPKIAKFSILVSRFNRIFLISWEWNYLRFSKSSFSEKAKKIWKNHPLVLTLLITFVRYIKKIHYVNKASDFTPLENIDWNRKSPIWFGMPNVFAFSDGDKRLIWGVELTFFYTFQGDLWLNVICNGIYSMLARSWSTTPDGFLLICFCSITLCGVCQCT